MCWKSAALLIFMIAGLQGKPVNPTIDESINKIDLGTRNKAKDARQLSSSENDVESLPEPTTSRIDVTSPNVEIATTTRPGPLAWFLTPLAQNIQFSPQSFLQDRIVQLRDTLNSLGLQVRQEVKGGKQFGNVNGLLTLVGANDSGFYTNRLEPAGFLGGNGWLANKGGILGGPGAILSTGSILTDYPTPYRKK